MTDRASNPRRGLGAGIIAFAMIGAIAVAVTIARDPGRRISSSKPAPAEATEDYGRRLIAQTSELLGPDQPDASMRYTQSRLACGSCHLATGTENGTLTLMQTTRHYPRFSGRVGAQTDIEDRINECMQRSMNGKPLPADSTEMIAMAAYLRSLGDRYAAMGATKKKASEPAAFATPNRAADVNAGESAFKDRCAICHGGDGLGLLATTDKRRG